MGALPPLFAGMDDEPARIVHALLRPVAYRPGDVLFHQGERADRAFFVLEGAVAIDVRLPGGATSRLTTLGPGDVLGELSLLSDGHLRTATARANDRVQCLVMERRDLLAICAQFHPASSPVLGRLADHVLRSIERVAAERVALGGAPVAAPAVERSSEPGATFDVLPHLPSLAFTAEFARAEAIELLTSGELLTVPAGGIAPRSVGRERTWLLVVRGAISLCATSGGSLRRLAVVGPGRLAVSDAFSADGRASSRDGATGLALGDDAVERWRNADERWMQRAQVARVQALMERLAEDTRSLARERRQAPRQGGWDE